MIRTTIMLPDRLKERIERSAQAHNIGLGELLRRAAEEFLQKEERPITRDPLVSGDFVIREPGPSDVSANIDRYLYGGKG